MPPSSLADKQLKFMLEKQTSLVIFVFEILVLSKVRTQINVYTHMIRQIWNTIEMCVPSSLFQDLFSQRILMKSASDKGHSSNRWLWYKMKLRKSITQIRLLENLFLRSLKQNWLIITLKAECPPRIEHLHRHTSDTAASYQ